VTGRCSDLRAARTLRRTTFSKMTSSIFDEKQRRQEPVPA